MAILTYVTPQVALELGPRAEFMPSDLFAVRSFVTEEFLNIIAEGQIENAGTSMAVQKKLLRRAVIQTTINTYVQAVSAAKREAVHEVAKVLLSA